MAYPVTISVTPPSGPRNRLTTAFRAILAIPHVILVGGVGMGVAYNTDGTTSAGAESGLLGAVALFLAFVTWCTVVFAGREIIGVRQFIGFYVRWRLRAISYLMLLEDQYPPFADTAYPATVAVEEPAGPRDRITVLFRVFLAIPHFVVLAFVLCGWLITTAVAWFAILLTGRYPGWLYQFGVGALTWRTRVDAYVLLLVDDYPPFSLE